MKKSLLIGLLTVGIANSLFAQPERMPFGDKSNYSITRVKPASSAKTYTSSSQGKIFDDFEGTDYVLTNSWEIKRGTSLNFDELYDATDPKWFLCKPSSFNGNGSTYIFSGSQSVAISYNSKDATWLIRKDTIAVPPETTLYLKFWLWYYSNYAQGYVTHFDVFIYDVDSHTIDSLKSWGDYDTISVSNQFNSRVVIPLSKFAGKNIRIALVYTNELNENKGTQLAVDNFTVTDNEDPDLSISAIPFSYSSQPHFLYDSLSLDLKAKILNQGSTLEDTATVEVTSTQLPNFNSSLQITDTIAEGETKSIKLPDKITLTAAGDYKILFQSSAEQDVNEENNSDSVEFSYSNILFATDYGVAGGFSLGMNQEFGNVYTVAKDAFISGIQIEWPYFSTSGFTPFKFHVQIHELNPIDNTISKTLYTDYFTKTEDNSSATVNYQLNDPVFCTHGYSYLVTVTQTGTTSLGMGYDGEKEGSFWKVNQSSIERMANPTIGNVALRLTMEEPEQNPKVTFTVKNNDGEVIPDIKIYIPELDSTLTTDEYGVAGISLGNGNYSYQINAEGLAQVNSDFRVFYQDLFINITLEKPYWVKFHVANESDEPIAGAEILLEDSLLVTDSNGTDSLLLAPNFYSYHVMASGYEKYDWGFLDHEGKDTLINITLTAATTHNLTIEVLNEKDEYLSDAEVAVPGYGWKYTDNEGKVTFAGISDSNVDVTTYKYNYAQNFANINLVSDSTIQIKLVAERYTATFHVTSKGSPMANAEIIVEGIDTVSTEPAGYAIVDYIPFGNDIPFTVKYNGYNTYTGTFDIDDRDVRIDVALIPTYIDPNSTSPVAIYPNPSMGEFTIASEGKYSIQIFDLTGRLVYSNYEASDETTVNISQKPSGIYIIKIVVNNGIVTRRIIKQ